MPLTGEEPIINVSGQTAQLTFCGRDGVRVQVCVMAPRGLDSNTDDAMEKYVLIQATRALKSALDQISRPGPPP